MVKHTLKILQHLQAFKNLHLLKGYIFLVLEANYSDDSYTFGMKLCMWLWYEWWNLFKLKK